VLFIPWTLAGSIGVTSRALLMAAAWVLNLLVAEWIIRRRRRPARGSAAAVPRPAVAPTRR
jgi:hypothetical protein